MSRIAYFVVTMNLILATWGALDFFDGLPLSKGKMYIAYFMALGASSGIVVHEQSQKLHNKK